MSKLSEAVSRFRDADFESAEYHAAAKAVWDMLSGAETDSLYQHLSAPTPIWDGDHCSKSGRDGLIEAGLAVRVCHRGEQGYTAAMYPAYSLFRSVNGDDAIKELQKKARERTRRAAEKMVARRAEHQRSIWPWEKRKHLSVILGEKP